MSTQRVYGPFRPLLERIQERGQKEQARLIQTHPKKVTRLYKGMWRMYAQALRRQREPIMDRLMSELYDYTY